MNIQEYLDVAIRIIASVVVFLTVCTLAFIFFFVFAKYTLFFIVGVLVLVVLSLIYMQLRDLERQHKTTILEYIKKSLNLGS